MDGLSAAASIIAVIQIAQDVGSGLKDYYECVRDARDDIQKLYRAIKSLEAILKSIQELLNLPSSQDLLCETLFTDQAGPLKQCQEELERLESELWSSGNPGKVRKAIQSLLWPFKKNDVEKRVTMLERYKSSLSLGIGLENLNKMHDVFDIANDIYSDIRATREEKPRQEIIAWLQRGVPDPSKEHNEARSKHEKNTGSWLLESHNFESWINGSNSFLWLNGNAGTGKSVMCSTIIDYIQKQNDKEPSTAVVYWYFTFTDTEKQDVSNAVCSIIADICSNRRDTPEELQNAFQRNNCGLQKPPLRDLIVMLRAVMDRFQHVYLIMDALDECPKADNQRETLLDLLREAHSWQLKCLHLLATSRREVDIQESLNSFSALPSTIISVSVQGSQVEQDIMKYLEHHLKRHKFSSWKPSLKEDVKEGLAKRADGMFRLVAFQLDTLSRIRVEAKIRAAITTLPRTLEAFYDRMLQEIKDPDDQEYARRAFLWIAYSARPVTLEELAEAVIVLPPKPQHSLEEDRFLECQDLLRIIPSGLVSVVATPVREEDEWLYTSLEAGGRPHSHIGSRKVIQFAHFSVEEYLFSLRTSMTTPGYQITRYMADSEILSVCFSYLIHVGFQDPGISRETIIKFPLLTYTAAFWTHHMQRLASEHLTDQLVKLALEFMRYDTQPWQMWTAITFDDLQYKLDGKFKDPINTRNRPRALSDKSGAAAIHPITWICIADLISLLRPILMDPDLDINGIPATKYLGEPLYAAARAGRRQIVDLLLGIGADVNHGEKSPLVAACRETCDIALVDSLLLAGARVNAVDDFGNNALQAASRHHDSEEIIKLLLKNGVDVNAKGGEYGSAVQIATYWGHKHIVRHLVEARADVSAQWGSYGSTLQEAVLRKDPDILELLIEAGLDVNTVIDAGTRYEHKEEMSALRFATISLREDHVKMILESATLRVEPEEWTKTYFNAEKIFLYQIKRYLLIPGNDKRRSQFKAALSLREMLRSYAKRHELAIPDPDTDVDILGLIEDVVAPVGSEPDSIMSKVIRDAVALIELEWDAEISRFIQALEEW